MAGLTWPSWPDLSIKTGVGVTGGGAMAGGGPGGRDPNIISASSSVLCNLNRLYKIKLISWVSRLFWWQHL